MSPASTRPAASTASQGDIHPQGNPHVQTNPHNIAAIAGRMGQRMRKLDADNADVYRHAWLISNRAGTRPSRLGSKAAPLRGKRVITHHKSWVYLEDWLGLVEVANLEEVPGIPPTAAYLCGLVPAFEGEEPPTSSSGHRSRMTSPPSGWPSAPGFRPSCCP